MNNYTSCGDDSDRRKTKNIATSSFLMDWGRWLLILIFLYLGKPVSFGQCSVDTSATISGQSAVCPGSPANVTLNNSNQDQWYVFKLNGVAVLVNGQYINQGTRRHKPLTYNIQHMTSADAGHYTLVAYDACGDSVSYGSQDLFYDTALSGLQITAITDNSVTFQWNPIYPGETYEYLISKNQNPPLQNTTQTTLSTVTINKLTPGTTYYIFVAGDCNGGNMTGPFEMISFTTTNGSTCSTPTISTPNGATSFCSGSNIILTSSTAQGYQWYLNGTAITSAVNQTYSATATGNYSVKATYSNGCSASSTNQSITAVASPPVPVIQASGPAQLCTGNSITLTSSASTGNQWYKDAGAISGATSSSLIVAVAGSYTVSVSNGNCSAVSAAAVITVNSGPPTNPTITPSGNASICNGASLVLTSSSANNNQWYLNGVAIPEAVNPTFTATLAGSYTVQLTTAGTCNNPSAPTVVTVSSTQSGPTISALGATTFCRGDSVILFSSASANNQWFKDGSIINGATNQTYIAIVSGNYMVQLSNSGGCGSISNVIAVTVNDNPSSPTLTPAGQVDLCTGQSVVLQSSVANGNQWYVSGGLITGATAATYTATEPGNYYVGINSTGTCPAISAATSVAVFSSPAVPSISVYDSTSMCGKDSVLLISSSASANQWYKDGTSIPGATNQYFPATESGIYTVQVSNAGNCSVVSTPLNVNVVSSLTKPIITLVNGVLTSNSISGNQWYFNDTLIASATNNTFIPTKAGKYTLRVTKFSCTSDFSDPYVITAGILVNQTIRIYPNPADHQITLVNSGANPVTVQIFNILGKRMMIISSVTGTIQITCAGWPRAAYVFFVTDEVTKRKSQTLILKK